MSSARVEEPFDPLADGEAVRDDPGPFLTTGLAARDWLDASWDTLHAAAARAPVQGQRGQLAVALDVAARELDLPPPTLHA